MSIILNEINYFWKLGFNEENVDLYIKRYNNNFSIIIDTEKKRIQYGKQLYVIDNEKTSFSQKNFIILELIDRLLSKGYYPKDIIICGGSDYDLFIKGISLAIRCLEYEYEYDTEISKIKENNSSVYNIFKDERNIKLFCLYSSRMKAGLIEYRYAVIDLNDYLKKETIYTGGLFEPEISAYKPKLSTTYSSSITIGDFVISDGILMKYVGTDTDIAIPTCVNRISNAVFWGAENIIRVTIPDTVKNLGGDTFCDCINLTELTIPRSVEIMGDNPFANCPKLNLKNESPHFIFKDGGLYNKEMTKLIYFAINHDSDSVSLPEGLIKIGKHAFYNCQNLQRIVIPKSVRIIENNPFSNINNLTLENNSPYFVKIDGALYDKSMTTLFYYEHGKELKDLKIPEGVRIIGRHSFYNCQTIRTITIPRSVEIIGYNPFTNCSNLHLINNSPEYVYENDTLFNKDKTELIYHSIAIHSKQFIIPDTVKKIGRNAFFGCKNLEEITIPEGLTFIERSAFSHCSKLQYMYIPNSVKEIDDCAFAYCSSLKEISISKDTKIKDRTFLHCSANIIRR